MIDLHCHILPGVDDGPKNLDESMELVRIFKENGYDRVVATPHFVPGTTWMPALEKIQNKLAELNHAITNKSIDFDVLPGMEIGFDPLIPDLLKKGQLLTLGQTPYVLIETPFQQLPLGWEQVVFTILSKGYFILLAHPERCAQLAIRPQLVDRLIEAGIYLQVNWDSFLGYHGRDALRMAHYLAESSYIHCLATDSHNPQERHAAHVKLAATKIQKLIGSESLACIAVENPARVLRGVALSAMEKPVTKIGAKKGSKWRFW